MQASYTLKTTGVTTARDRTSALEYPSKSKRKTTAPTESRLESTASRLIGRVRDGRDDLAWKEFDHTYRTLAIRFCLGRGMQLADAEDVAQAVMMSLARSLPRFKYDRSLGRFRSYVLRAVYHESLRHARATRFERPLDRAAHITDENEDPNLRIERDWRRHHIRRATDQLVLHHDRRTLDIFSQLAGGRDVTKVARLFATSPANVAKIRTRIVGQIRDTVARQMLGEEHPEPAPGTFHRVPRDPCRSGS